MMSGHTKMKNDYLLTGKNVIDLQIKALKKLKNSLDKSFNSAVNVIIAAPVIICGRQSGIIV